MSESDGKARDGQWVAAWIEQQREALRKSLAEGNQKVETDAGTAGATAANAGPNPFDRILRSWRGTWSEGMDGPPGTAGPFAELLQRMPAIGPMREHAEAWREVIEAQVEFQQLQRELREVLFRVQNDALDLVQKRVSERRTAGAPVEELRDLHKLWVECGEEVYAKVAHSDAFGHLQGQLANATVRLRARQQKVMEQWLKQFDLPTRSELNTVHRQLREQKEKLREHKELLSGFIGRMKPTKTRSPAKAKAKKRTSR